MRKKNLGEEGTVQQKRTKRIGSKKATKSSQDLEVEKKNSNRFGEW